MPTVKTSKIKEIVGRTLCGIESVPSAYAGRMVQNCAKEVYKYHVKKMKEKDKNISDLVTKNIQLGMLHESDSISYNHDITMLERDLRLAKEVINNLSLILSSRNSNKIDVNGTPCYEFPKWNAEDIDEYESKLIEFWKITGEEL